MSNMHPCAWASDKGRELKLSCPERVTLWQLAERAASKGFCWPSLSQLMVDTGLARASLVRVLRSLAAKGLIEISKFGKQGHNYKVLQPVQNKTGNRSKSEPISGSNLNRSNVDNRSKSEPQTGSKASSNRFKSVQQTGSNLNPNLKREPEKEPSAGTQADADAPPPPLPGGRSGGAPSPEIGKAPSLGGTTTGGGVPANAFRPPGAPPDPFADRGETIAWLKARGFTAEADAISSRQPKSDRPRPISAQRPLAADMPAPDTVTEDDRPRTEADRQRMAAQMEQARLQLQAEYRERADANRYGRHMPGHAPVLTPSEQQTVLHRSMPAVRAYHLTPEQLAVARRSAGIGQPP